MLEKFTVYAWHKREKEAERRYHKVWGGKSLIKAIYEAWKAKAYSGCIKIEWGGTR